MRCWVFLAQVAGVMDDVGGRGAGHGASDL